MLPLPGTREHESALMQVDDWGFFGLRMESIGGYGAHVAGRILTEAGVIHQGLNGSNFSSYGSEKKGSPVKAFVRFTASDNEVRSSAPIEEPHIIAVFHEALIRTQAVTSGLRPGGLVILNTRKSPEDAARLLKLEDGVVGVVDAIGIALEEKSRVNMVMLGSLCHAMPFIDCEAVKAVISETFQKKYAKTIPGNLRAFERGYREVEFWEIPRAPGYRRPPVARPEPAFGYLNAPLGGLIVNPANSIHKDLSASRQGMVPEFLRDKCIDCAQCDMVCPDICFVWADTVDKKGKPVLELRGIDYQYCKGCMKCVEICPVAALQSIREEDGWADQYRVAHHWHLAEAGGD